MNLKDAYYEMKFENLFLRAKGNEFQTLFNRLMELAYKADFMACRPWGRRGDRKNDGFLKSERRLFQVYAPNEMKESEAMDKIIEDFDGAKVHWGTDFDRWVFVHNATNGLPAHIHQLIFGLEKTNTGITLEPWGLEELRLIFRCLSSDDLEVWLGPAPTEETKINLGFKDIQVVLETLAGKANPSNTVIQPVPSGKIEANDLSESVITLIKNGMTKTPLVSSFFDTWHDETLGERLASAFRIKYGSLRGTMHPNRIFSELQTWIGGSNRGTAAHEMAILTILAYYFERCEIFEEPLKAK